MFAFFPADVQRVLLALSSLSAQALSFGKARRLGLGTRHVSNFCYLGSRLVWSDCVDVQVMVHQYKMQLSSLLNIESQHKMKQINLMTRYLLKDGVSQAREKCRLRQVTTNIQKMNHAYTTLAHMAIDLSGWAIYDSTNSSMCIQVNLFIAEGEMSITIPAMLCNIGEFGGVKCPGLNPVSEGMNSNTRRQVSSRNLMG
ncbi:uncharacterized protein F5891DRAFT_1019665 [Suillus fuscotomentosus]|uniref:Uncharacterized protein n=1 Tax=Suillus fuscotomentosus TaxID=1912939 RepID=A0AAD4EC03_9AGAM|nr:uncharacterized protein F5891DRAFT_1019665 [Suillus fuscotomentosus]KAG1903475.1 hypothetical protein F5891DRAFT_1019665 [Suillus fuscotomentosus]